MICTHETGDVKQYIKSSIHMYIHIHIRVQNSRNWQYLISSLDN